MRIPFLYLIAFDIIKTQSFYFVMQYSIRPRSVIRCLSTTRLFLTLPNALQIKVESEQKYKKNSYINQFEIAKKNSVFYKSKIQLTVEVESVFVAVLFNVFAVNFLLRS